MAPAIARDLTAVPLTYSRACALMMGAVAELERNTPLETPTLRDDMQSMHTAWQTLYAIWSEIEANVRYTRLMSHKDGRPDVKPLIEALVGLMAQSAQFAVHLSTNPIVMDRAQAVSEGRRDMARLKILIPIHASPEELDDDS